MRNIRYQAQDIVIPSGTAPGQIIQATVTLDNNYRRCTGVMFVDTSQNTNIERVNIGFRNPQGVVIDSIESEGLVVNPSTPVDQRFISVEFFSDGRQMTITAFPNQLNNTPLLSERSFQVVFRLEDQIS